MIKLEPNLKIQGIDISNYAINKAFKHKNIKLKNHKAEKKYNFKKNYFDLVISLGTLHNLEIFNLEKALKEIQRVGKKKFIMVESYKNDKQLFNLQCWALTCQSFLNPKEWKWVFKNSNYTGDYEFIYFD